MLAEHRRELQAAVCDARQRTLELVGDLSDEQLMGPRLAITNPLLWEIGHVAWFQEKWVLRRSGRPSLRGNADALFDSAAIPHDVRWDLPLPGRRGIGDYLGAVRDAVLEALDSGPPDPALAYFTVLSVLHEDMHTEAFTYTRQTLGYPPPVFSAPSAAAGAGLPGIEREAAPETAAGGDAWLAGGTLLLGALPTSLAAPSPSGPALPGSPAGAEPPGIVARLVFDNEKWAHPVEVPPFGIARTAVTQAEFAAFVEGGGYRRSAHWSAAGWAWRQACGAENPVYWRPAGWGSWERRCFDRWVALEPDLPVLHVNWFEAEAYCRWAGRRLPTEAEWEMAAAGGPVGGAGRRFPWGDHPPAAHQANLDWNGDRPGRGCAPVDALPAGDSPCGCRQLIGNVWEWTATDFGPYPGFVPDPYAEYSAPWFGDHKVLRGGCWVTRSRLIRNTWRNFYRPERRDVWAGFRTCALPS